MEAYNETVVPVIVALDSAAMSADKSMDNILGSKVNSERYNAKRAEMTVMQDAVMAEIASIAGAEFAVSARYFITVNGFAVNLQRGFIDKIRNFPA